MHLLHRISKRHALITILAASLATLGVIGGLGIAKPLESDAVYFTAIAQNLIEQGTYANPRSPWPTAPAVDRLPGWTSFIALGLFSFRGIPAPVVVRLLSAFLNILAAWLLSRLTFRLTRNEPAALLAGVSFSFYLPALYVAQSALSEPGFICLLLLGVSDLASRKFMRASFLLGMGSLFRANILLILPGLALYLFWQLKGEPRMRKILLIVAALLLFAIPPAAWILRNAWAANCFPVLSTTSGEVIRGSYNPVVARGELWGYWVFPNEIPGEIPFQDLARKMSQCEVNRYYQSEARSFARDNLSLMPSMVLGRLFRSYVPIPIKVSLTSILGFGNRWLLYLAFFLTLGFWKRRLPAEYAWILLMFFSVSLVTTIVMVGNSRHVLWMEVLLFPPAACGLFGWLQSKSAHQIGTHQN